MNNELRKAFHMAYIQGNKEKIKDILSEDLPHSLIKFCGGAYDELGNNYGLKTLKEKAVWLSSPNEFNDPFDCAINVDYEREIQEESSKALENLFGKEMAKQILDGADAIIQEKAKEIREAFRDQDSSVANNVFVACFSEKENLSSLRMWAYYANYHKGFCLEYDFCEMNCAFKDGVIPILYSDAYSKNYECLSEEECRKFRLGCAFTKATEWDFEKEWRILSCDESRNGEKGYQMDFIKPSKVYLGCKCDERLKVDLKEICYDLNIGLYQMRMKPETFCLESKQI